jgi:peroxiredoxin Q/BCP
LKTKGYEIIGVSADNVKAQKNFAEKYHLNFPLIADTEKNIIKSYGAWGK